MPSPFPGMDPYLEGQLWPGFQVSMMAALQLALAPLLRPRYVSFIEVREYVDPEPELPPCPSPRNMGRPSASRKVQAPVKVLLPVPERVRERYLEIRRRGSREAVTVVELLSPANKRPGGDGREEYLAKRKSVIDSRSHLVELDLLRGGERLPMGYRLPPADYYVVLSRVRRRPTAEVWPFTLRDSLPVIPIPLAEEDPDVALDLQEVFANLYDAAGYDLALDYSRDPSPPLPEAEAAWARGLVGLQR